MVTGDLDGQDFANAFQKEVKKRSVNVVESARFSRGDTSHNVQQKVIQVCSFIFCFLRRGRNSIRSMV